MYIFSNKRQRLYYLSRKLYKFFYLDNNTSTQGGVHMDISRMKNIIVLKDLPSNIVDEAIVVLKSGARLKNMETSDTKHKGNLGGNEGSNSETAIKEAEFIVENYLKGLEDKKTSNEKQSNIKKMRIQYRKMQVCTAILGLTSIIGICISIFK